MGLSVGFGPFELFLQQSQKSTDNSSKWDGSKSSYVNERPIRTNSGSVSFGSSVNDVLDVTRGRDVPIGGTWGRRSPKSVKICKKLVERQPCCKRVGNSVTVFS